jgi:hypothetical protein
MNDIVNEIIEVEKECNEKIDAIRSDNDTTIKKLIIQIENKRNEEKKRIRAENNLWYKNETERTEMEVMEELTSMKSVLNELKENIELCNEVRDRVVSLIFKNL